MIISYDKKSPITRPEDIAALLQAWLKTLDGVDRDKEHFIAILLNTRSKIKNIEIISIGIVNACLIHPREVFKRAILEASSQIIIAHNHPSGDCEPSKEDIEITERLKDAGKIIGIELLDHIVFSSNDYYSFTRNGLIK
jgi:DNA repair protein RadC